MNTASQETTATKALRLASSLTPLQRHLLVRAGTPRWLRLPAPWQPSPGRQLAVAQALATPEYAVLEPMPAYDATIS